jgi:hypothetical protein
MPVVRPSVGGMGRGGVDPSQGFDPTGRMGSSFIAPRGPGAVQMDLPEVTMDSSLCTFGMGDEVSHDDRLVLTSARQMASSLRNNSEQCRQATQQTFDAFNSSVEDFNNLNDTSRPLNPDSPVQDVTDMFSSCRSRPEPQAFACAQELISTARFQKRNTCETSREFISAQRSSQLSVSSAVLLL